jgi:hypothetical protein
MDATLSVCCISAEPLERTAAILRLFRDVAKQIVCAVDARVPKHEVAVLEGEVDVLKRCVVEPSTGIERCLPWLFGQCTGDWILRIDNDEVPGSELLLALPTLLEAKDVLQFVLPCRWLFPDPDHFLDENPWSEDWHVRLSRNDPIALRHSGRLHADITGVEPMRYIDLPFYHLDCAIHSLGEREQKIARYERAVPGLETMPGWSVNNHYLPERFQRKPSSTVPPEDARLIAKVLRTPPREKGEPRFDGQARPRSSTAITDAIEVDRTWPLREIPASAYKATWLSVPTLTELRAGQLHRVFVEVSNDGTETWPWGYQLPGIRLSYRWVSHDGTAVVAEGHSTAFTANVPPGTSILQPMTVLGPEEPAEYRIQFALVHEDVRWFGEGPALWVTVKP